MFNVVKSELLEWNGYTTLHHKGVYQEVIYMYKKIFVIFITSVSFNSFTQVSSWDCYELEGAKIIADDGTYLGTIDDQYGSDSIYNEYSDYGNEYSAESIWNEYSDYGDDYSSESAFNDYASDPPVLLKDGEVVGKLTTDPYEYDGYDAREIKDSCDW